MFNSFISLTFSDNATTVPFNSSVSYRNTLFVLRTQRNSSYYKLAFYPPSLSSLVQSGFSLFLSSCFCVGFGWRKNKTPKVGKKKMNFFLGWRKAHSFASFGLCLGFPQGRDRSCGLQMCVLLCVGFSC